jgi:hypothetical protein
MSDFDKLQIADILGLNDILRYNKLIDKQIDVDYACKYFKQVLVETRSPNVQQIWAELRRLEKCFLLFLRHTRFYLGYEFANTGHMTEFQAKSEFTFKTSFFRDEIFTINYLFSIGELHFVNKSYL